MVYDIEEERSYSSSAAWVHQAARAAVGGLGGKVLSDNGSDRLVVWFDKTIHGKVLGDRTQIEVALEEKAPNEITVRLKAYPVDPIGRKLMFGARKGVTQTVLAWYWAHLEHQLSQLNS